MSSTWRRNIKLLAEWWPHTIEYERSVILLTSKINQIRVWQEDKYGIRFTYNSNSKGEEHLKVCWEDVYDVAIQLLWRSELHPVGPNGGVLLTLDEWVNQEGRFAEKRLRTFRSDLEAGHIEDRCLGGNRYRLEYFKGIFILTDDLCRAKSNVVSA